MACLTAHGYTKVRSWVPRWLVGTAKGRSRQEAGQDRINRVAPDHVAIVAHSLYFPRVGGTRLATATRAPSAEQNHRTYRLRPRAQPTGKWFPEPRDLPAYHLHVVSRWGPAQRPEGWSWMREDRASKTFRNTDLPPGGLGRFCFCSCCCTQLLPILQRARHFPLEGETRARLFGHVYWAATASPVRACPECWLLSC